MDQGIPNGFMGLQIRPRHDAKHRIGFCLADQVGIAFMSELVEVNTLPRQFTADVQ